MGRGSRHGLLGVLCPGDPVTNPVTHRAGADPHRPGAPRRKPLQIGAYRRRSALGTALRSMRSEVRILSGALGWPGSQRDPGFLRCDRIRTSDRTEVVFRGSTRCVGEVVEDLPGRSPRGPRTAVGRRRSILRSRIREVDRTGLGRTSDRTRMVVRGSSRAAREGGPPRLRGTPRASSAESVPSRRVQGSGPAPAHLRRTP